MATARGGPRPRSTGVYVNFAVSRPADRWIEGLAPGGRLVFPLGAPGPQRPNSGGRHSDPGAALRIERRGDAYAARAVSAAYFVCAEGEFEPDREELERLRAAFEAGGIDTVRSLIWQAHCPIRPLLVRRQGLGFVSRRNAMSVVRDVGCRAADSVRETLACLVAVISPRAIATKRRFTSANRPGVRAP